MKRAISLIALTGLLVALANSSFAAGKDKEITISGDAKCAKCALKETEKCQGVIQTQENGKTVTYYLTDNKVSKDFHDHICRETQKVKATGKLKEENGKKVLTASKIELVKESAAK